MKFAVVSGGTRGIGRALVKALADAGYTTAFLYLNSDEAALSLSKETGALAYKCDVSVMREVKEAVEDILNHFPKIDLLINNAGISNGQKLFCDITEIEWQRLLSVNVTGVFNLTQCVLPQMIKRKSGSIINLSSVWGISGASCEVDYSASKGAVISLTKALAKEVAPSGIRVNCVAPGVVETDMNGHLDKNLLCEDIPLGRIASAEEIAQLTLSVAQSEYLTGQVISPNGGLVI